MILQNPFLFYIDGLPSARKGNSEVPAYFLKFKQGYTVRKMEKVNRVYIDNCRYEIQEQKEVPVRYAGMHRPTWRTRYASLLCVLFMDNVCLFPKSRPLFEIPSDNIITQADTRQTPSDLEGHRP
jgi:hypothetical protein